VIDCQLLIEYCPQIERLEIDHFYNIEYLRRTRLKYLCFAGDAENNMFVPYLPNTIESLIITKGLFATTIFNQLSSFSNIKYLDVKLYFYELKTVLNIDTMHFNITNNGRIIDCMINVPNATNIIISGNYMCAIKKLHLIAPNATKCKIISLNMCGSEIFLPKCPKVEMIDKIWKRQYDPDIF
jgi:hypothetical protein